MKKKKAEKNSVVLRLKQIAGYANSYISGDTQTLIYTAAFPKKIISENDFDKAEKFAEEMCSHFPEGTNLIGIICNYAKSCKSKSKSYFQFDYSVRKTEKIVKSVISETCSHSLNCVYAITYADGDTSGFILSASMEKSGLLSSGEFHSLQKSKALGEGAIPDEDIDLILLSLYQKHLITNPNLGMKGNTVTSETAKDFAEQGYVFPDEFINDEKPAGIAPLLLKGSPRFELTLSKLTPSERAIYLLICSRFYALIKCQKDCGEPKCFRKEALSEEDKLLTIKELCKAFEMENKDMRSLIRRHKIEPKNQIKLGHNVYANQYDFEDIEAAIGKESFE